MKKKARIRHSNLAELSHQELLDLRLCDLNLNITGSKFERCIAHLYRELDFKGVVFKPYFWLSDEFFCPEGIPGIAIPFYLAHPVLEKLEREMMFEAEGAEFDSALKILRHETGHALEHAYNLHLRKRKQTLFGSTRIKYPDVYTPRPFSKSYVVNLGNGYAQAHPDEDFAETFAVWLDPFSNWAAKYAGWPALKKLNYMNELIEEIGTQPPLKKTKSTLDDISKLTKTLRQHYEGKHKRYGLSKPINVHDADLVKVFGRPENQNARPTSGMNEACKFIKKHKKEIRKSVSFWTGQYQYLVDQVLEELLQRCRLTDLVLKYDEETTKRHLTLLTTVKTMKYLHAGGYQVVL